MSDNLLKKVKEGKNVFMTEIDETNYIESVTATLLDLIEDGYTGVYVSFQRPHHDLQHHFQEAGIDDTAVHVIDGVTMIEQEPATDPGEDVTYLPEDGTIDQLARTIYRSVENRESGKRFILIDSLTTLTLYQPLSETMRLAEFLIRTVDMEDDGTVLIFNVAKGQKSREFIKDIAFQVDEVIGIDD